MQSLVTRLGCKKYYSPEEEDYGNYRITKFSDIMGKIILLLEKYPLCGVKALEFADFKKVSLVIRDKGHVTEEGLGQIRLIKSNMNRSRIPKDIDVEDIDLCK